MDKTFEQYLKQLNHSDQTIKSYTYAVDNFLSTCIYADKYKYKDVLNYMEDKAKNYSNIRTKTVMLSGIKKYYDYLIEIGKRNDHPCRNLYLKGSGRQKGFIHTDLFSSGELEMMMEREERYAALKLKNQLIISLLIYQGLTAGEIANLKVQHIDLDKGTVFIKGRRRLSQRHLEIQPRQYRLLYRYIYSARKEMLKAETDILIIGKLGTPITVDDINYLVSTYKPLFPDRNLNARIIRQSVVTIWLNEKKIPLEQVQLMAGQKWISSTLRYRHTPIEERREMMNRFHPMG